MGCQKPTNLAHVGGVAFDMRPNQNIVLTNHYKKNTLTIYTFSWHLIDSDVYWLHRRDTFDNHSLDEGAQSDANIPLHTPLDK